MKKNILFFLINKIIEQQQLYISCYYYLFQDNFQFFLHQNGRIIFLDNLFPHKSIWWLKIENYNNDFVVIASAR